ncbi:prepilin peptidase [Ruminococcaceae bacterium OttesenSCG-928-A11]|nr:prepilin peptidase [Ruminococcaceae bacterium OttesenSCG-928-A11]
MELSYILSSIVGISILVVFICLAFYDIRYQRLPNVLIIVQIILCIVFTYMIEVIIEQKDCSVVLITHILALLPVSGVYLLLYVLSKGKMIGFGDVKLGVPIAILLSWQGALITLGLANILALIVYAPLLLTKKIKLNTKISFGPFLIISCLLTFFAMKFFVNFF